MGSMPSSALSRASAARLRASARLTVWIGPSPFFRARAVDHVAEHPRLGVEGADLKVKPVAIAVEAGLLAARTAAAVSLLPCLFIWIRASVLRESTHKHKPASIGCQRTLPDCAQVESEFLGF